MKRIFYSVILTAFAFSILFNAGKAKASDNFDYSDGYFTEEPDTFIVDGAGLLTDEEVAEINNAIISFNGNEYSTEREFIICIVTTNDLHGKTPESYADDFYDNNYHKYGYTSGICFLRYITKDGSQKNVWISTCGEGIVIFNDNDIQHQIDLIADDIIDGKYKSAFLKFINNVESEIRKYDATNDSYTSWDYDDYDDYREQIGYNGYYAEEESFNYIKAAVISLLLGVVVAFIIVSTMKSKLTSVHFATNADQYVVPGSFRLTRNQDIFLSRHVSKTAIPQDNGSSGSHGSSHHSSSGVSHGGGGRGI